MNTPDPGLPFFAYGLFKPGQLGYFQIREFVKHRPWAVAAGRLLVRDGLPFLVPDDELTVRRALLGFSDSGAAYERIVDMEPRHLYRWRTIEVAGRAANVLYGTKPSCGNPLDWPSWDGWEDPLFTEALTVVKETWEGKWAQERLLAAVPPPDGLHAVVVGDRALPDSSVFAGRGDYEEDSDAWGGRRFRERAQEGRSGV